MSLLGLLGCLLASLAGGCRSVPRDAEGRMKLGLKLYEDGLRELERGEAEEAMELLDRSVGLYPDHVPTHRELGLLHFHRARASEQRVMELEEKALRLKDEGDYRGARGVQDDIREAHGEALPHLDRALYHLESVARSAADDVEVLEVLGRCHVYRGDFRVAREYFVQAAGSPRTPVEERRRYEEMVRALEQEIAVH
ncbi:MAG: hypothetical protein HY722_15510 [Planctomycetes bacterium]|nr:hypothetical protein [Planctomycetota bacterium]